MNDPAAETHARIVGSLPPPSGPAPTGGETWRQWLNWTPEAEKLAELTDWYVALTATDDKGKPLANPPKSWRPAYATAAETPADLDLAYARLMGM